MAEVEKVVRGPVLRLSDHLEIGRDVWRRTEGDAAAWAARLRSPGAASGVTLGGSSLRLIRARTCGRLGCSCIQFSAATHRFQAMGLMRSRMRSWESSTRQTPSAGSSQMLQWT
jgi:hypothetical protein